MNLAINGDDIEVRRVLDALRTSQQSERMTSFFGRGPDGVYRVEIDETTPISDAERAALLALVAVPKALAHGASLTGLIGWDPKSAFPRLQQIDTIGQRGFLRREAWYRPSDCDYGLTTTPKAGAVAVYAIDYPSWTYGLLPGSASTRGIIERGPRVQTWGAEDGSTAKTLTDAEPKLYSYIEALGAGARRRVNVVGSGDNMTASRVAGIVATALMIAYPNEDPGARVGALLAVLDGAIRLYRATGDGLDKALADPGLRDPSIGFPWLDTTITVPGVGDVPAIVLLQAEVTEPPDGRRFEEGVAPVHGVNAVKE
jgi:hypothetical protein